ncbi:hypothetical protein BKA64DRAFT_721004 [Cadophora sp. MPI-SDFR-AT-0126]|nr:hypothetical protein BKA64DRAFT_721004 [Leotiomycetes sp. MPI-SDFR-AT-0126]
MADIMKDSSSTPFAILGFIVGEMGAGVGRQTALQKASSARGLMKDSDLAKFSAEIQGQGCLDPKDGSEDLCFRSSTQISLKVLVSPTTPNKNSVHKNPSILRLWHTARISDQDIRFGQLEGTTTHFLIPQAHSLD